MCGSGRRRSPALGRGQFGLAGEGRRGAASPFLPPALRRPRWRSAARAKSTRLREQRRPPVDGWRKQPSSQKVHHPIPLAQPTSSMSRRDTPGQPLPSGRPSLRPPPLHPCRRTLYSTPRPGTPCAAQRRPTGGGTRARYPHGQPPSLSFPPASPPPPVCSRSSPPSLSLPNPLTHAAGLPRHPPPPPPPVPSPAPHTRCPAPLQSGRPAPPSPPRTAGRGCRTTRQRR